ncbi:sulfatase-like hydrolase/transferase [Phytoactinopolyspora halotolerans]|uniref:Sulfatase-like hydrolase/transferase n=1 Tax=Phytoactinopolyspora halotolerans TaxID=1981512 RepID=A0A6L9SDA6_9ACTN|nr:sulfatase-like hydrolase/transferase [Phytoactinopolyspora halotolerans]NEE03236.1 sulfatase-like hydrolase/transferase [Phytoactinopolyspora halotolerans]
MTYRPNFLIVVADQLRADTLGAFGNTLARTPNLDRLAAEGTAFTNAYAQHPVCSPSRASFLSGWYPHTAGHRTFGTPLRADEPNFLRTMRESGYHVTWVGERGDTFAVGATETSVDEYGFSTKPTSGRWAGGVRAGTEIPQLHDASGHEQHVDPDLWDRLFYYGKVTDPDYVDFDEAAVRTAEEWLSHPPQQPWVLFAPLVAPHCPFQAPEPWFSLHDRDAMPDPAVRTGPEPAFMQGIRDYYGTDRATPDVWREVIATYFGMVSRFDAHVGRLLEGVRKAGAADDTVVVVFSDHGEYLGDFGLIEKWPSGLENCITRDPVIISGGGLPGAGQVEAMVELIDVFPTVLEVAGVEASYHHFGRSLVPLLHDPSAPHREYAFSEGGFRSEEEEQIERSGFPYDRKAALQHDRPRDVGKAVAVRDRRWTYVWRLYEEPELYDRADDPDEAHNLIGRPELSEVETRMRDALLRWFVETGDVLPERAEPRLPDIDLPVPGRAGASA